MTTTNPRVRAADRSDAYNLAEIAAKTFRQTYERMIGLSDLEAYIQISFSFEKMESELQRQDSQIFIGETPEEVIGYCKVQLGPAPKCIQGLRPAEFVRSYVDRDAQGLGLGRAFFECRKDWAFRQRCDGLWLSVWNKNLRGIEFHKKMGFVQVGEQDFIVGTDVQRDLLMYHPL